MTTVYAATGQDIVRLTRTESDDWHPEALLSDASARCLAIDLDDPRRLLAGTAEHGALISNDGGQSWRNAGNGIPHTQVLSVEISRSRKVHGRNVLFAGTEPSSIFVSEDDGETWHDLPALRDLPSAPTWSFPPRPWTSHVRWIATSWHNPDLIVAGIELGGVMRSTDGGATWEDRKPGSYHDCHCLQMHPKDAHRIYEASGGGVATSQDAGETWIPVDEGMDRHYAWGLAIDPEDPDRWFVSAAPGPRNAHRDLPSAEAKIYRKQGDAPWTSLPVHDGELLDEMPYALLIPRDTPHMVIAGTNQGSLYESRDRGDSWRRIDTELPAILQIVHA